MVLLFMSSHTLSAFSVVTALKADWIDFQF